MPPLVHAKGRRGPDPDKHLFGAYRSSTNFANLPSQMSYEYLYGPIEDQGQAGSCAAFAPKQLVDAILTKRLHPVPAPLLSAAALYSMTKHLREPDDLGVQGLYAQDVLWVLQNVGYVRETDWPYSDNASYLLERVPTRLIRTDHDLTGFRRVGGNEMGTAALNAAILLALYDLGPLVFGIQFQTDWENIGPDGILDPNPSGGDAGGHEMNLVGSSSTRRAYRIRNQWGPAWGSSGYGWLSWDCSIQPDDVYAISL